MFSDPSDPRLLTMDELVSLDPFSFDQSRGRLTQGATSTPCLLSEGRMPKLSMRPLLECMEDEEEDPFRPLPTPPRSRRSERELGTPQYPTSRLYQSEREPGPTQSQTDLGNLLKESLESNRKTMDLLNKSMNDKIEQGISGIRNFVEDQMERALLRRDDEKPKPTIKCPTVNDLIQIETPTISRRPIMKPSKFDGIGSLQSFLCQFQVCAQHNRWNAQDKLDYLKHSLEKGATQALWDFGSSKDMTYEGLVAILEQRFGTNDQAETFRTQLQCLKRKRGEPLSELMQQVRKLMVLAYPVASSDITEILAKDFFINALSDRDLILKIKEKEPKSLDEAYRMTIRFEAYQQGLADTPQEKPNRERHRVQVAAEGDNTNSLRSERDQWRQKAQALENELRSARAAAPSKTDNEPVYEAQAKAEPPRPNGNWQSSVKCYNCDKLGHIARYCKSPRKPRKDQPQHNLGTTGKTSQVDAGNDTRSLFLRVKIKRRFHECLIDTGSDVNLMPLDHVKNEALVASTRTLMAANGSTINICGELNVPVKPSRGLSIMTNFIVSDQVMDPILGIRWLTENRCSLDFGKRTLRMGKITIRLTRHANNNAACRRVIAREDTIVPAKSQADVSVKTVLGSLRYSSSDNWLTESHEIEGGVQVARTLLSDSFDRALVRVMNVKDHPVTIAKGTNIGELAPVDAIDQTSAPARIEPITEEILVDLLEKIHEDVTKEEKHRLVELLNEYSDILSKDDMDLGEARLVQHRINTGDTAPIRQPLRRQPLLHTETIDEHTKNLLKAKVIEPSAGEWAANVVLAKKKDGTLRFCIDYRQLNQHTLRDSYPLPRIDDCLDTLRGATWFSTMDLRSGFHQVAMHEPDKDKTAFLTKRGIFRFRKMPFGLCNAPATFQRLMDIMLAGLSYDICLAYLDDIIVFSTDVETHLGRLRQIFDRLRRTNLKLKPSKCTFLQRNVHFLGYIISAEGIAADPTKIESVVNWPTPERLRDVRSFLGLCSYYRKMVRGFSEIAAPLHALTQKNAPFIWTEKCQNAFDQLKSSLVSAPILSLPTDEGTYYLDCDASDHGIGAVLSQTQDGKEKVIAYASRLYGRPERNYCVTRKELLAVVFFTKMFKQYLLGRAFIIRSDHAALSWLRKTPEPIGQQARWLERLEEFSYTIEHRPGRSHGNADGMSRLPCKQCGICRVVTASNETDKPNSDPWESLNLADAQMADRHIGPIYHWCEEQNYPTWGNIPSESETTKTLWHERERLVMMNNVLYRKASAAAEPQIVVPFSLRRTLFKLVHADITNCHLGVSRTIAQMRRRAYWVGWSRDVQRFCRECPECARYHRGTPPKQGLLQPISVGEPFETISIDITGPHPRSRSGKIYILTIMDQFSKYVEAVAIPNQEASTVARALVNAVIVRYGTPLSILSDQGTNFESQLFKELCKVLRIDKVRTSPYRASTNGMIERFHRTLNSMIAKVVNDNQRNWCEILPQVVAAYRATVHEATGYSPNFLIFGHENRAPVDLVLGRPTEDIDAARPVNEYVDEFSERMENAYGIVREHLAKAAEIRKKRYDLRVNETSFTVGSFVWYYTPRRYQGRSPKWQKNYGGPFLITERRGPVNYVLQKSKSSKPFVTHIDKLKYCYLEGLKSWLGNDEVATKAAEEDSVAESRKADNESPPASANVENNRPRRQARRPARFID